MFLVELGEPQLGFVELPHVSLEEGELEVAFELDEFAVVLVAVEVDDGDLGNKRGALPRCRWSVRKSRRRCPPG